MSSNKMLRRSRFMDYNFIDNEVNQSGYIFKTDYDFPRLQGRKTEINYKILVLNDIIKTISNLPSCHCYNPAPFQIQKQLSVSALMKL